MPDTLALPAFPTIGAIAEHHHAKLHQVAYVIRRFDLQPIGKAGSAAVYSLDDVIFIGAMLNRIAAEKELANA